MRYLSPALKADNLKYWEQVKRDRPADAKDGYGFPDPPIYDLCDRLNAIEGVCTVQSCAGHRMAAADGSGEYQHVGKLWLRLSEPLALRFYERAPELASVYPTIQRVFVFWHESGEEVVDVLFQGLNVSEEAFDESSKLIADFFSSL